jgi:hypothetical protein
MKAAAASALVIVIGIGFAFNTASCSGQNACGASAGAGGTGGAGGTSGAGGSSDCTSSAGSAGAAATRNQLTALQTCFSAFCQADGAGSPFCTCFKRGYDLGAPPDCQCVPFNSAAFCQQAAANGVDGSNLDCSAATSSVATQCVGVQ